MVVLEYGRPSRKLSRKLIVTGILLCAFVAVLVFRGWRRGPMPVATVPATTSPVAPMYLILRTQDLHSAVFYCPPVQPTTREGTIAQMFLIVKQQAVTPPVFNCPATQPPTTEGIGLTVQSNGDPFAKPQAAK